MPLASSSSPRSGALGAGVMLPEAFAAKKTNNPTHTQNTKKTTLDCFFGLYGKDFSLLVFFGLFVGAGVLFHHAEIVVFLAFNVV